MQNQNHQPDNATKMFSTFVGIGMSSVALLLVIPVGQMLLFARDSRDMAGGIAGTVVLLVLLVTGFVLVLREKAPTQLMRAFYLGLGSASLVIGIGVFGWGIYAVSTGARIQLRALTMPSLFIALGVNWIRRGFDLTGAVTPATQYSDDSAR